MWTDSSVFYQIYPLGASGAPFENDHIKTNRLKRFHEWIAPLKELGVDTVLFNPLFQSRTHGYDVTDLSKVDDRLGTNEDLAKLTKELHENDLKVVFDAVFNHVGREFGPFQDVLKNRQNSRYKDWFVIDFNGNNSYNDGLWYQNWEGYDALVKLNLANPEVQNYIFDIVDQWIEEYGVDGLRLDVAYCLDRGFLKNLRSHVKSKNPDFFLLGETLHGDYNQWVNDEMLDSCTNYECYKGLYSSFNSHNFFEILYSLNRQFGNENWTLYRDKHLLSFLDNHDVNRIASMLVKEEHLEPAYAMLFTMPGIPCIYYGSEWGIKGEKNYNDTALRPEIALPKSNELTETISRLIDIKHDHTALHNGGYKQILLNNKYCVYERKNGEDTVWTAINIEDQPMQLNSNNQADENQQVTDLITNKKMSLRDALYLEPNSFRIIGF